MKILDTLPFAAEWLGPLHAQSYRRAEAVARAGEVAVDATWRVTTWHQEPATATAREHLMGFLAGSLATPLDGKPSGHGIRLVLDPAVGQAETHRLRVSATDIEVAGADAAGVLQGVFHLEALMKERGGPFVPLGEEVRVPAFRHRIHRSCLSPFYVDEMTGYDGPPLDARWLSPGMDYPGFVEEDAGPDTYYHDHMLLRLAEHGFNGIWVRGALKLFAKVPAFPECGADAWRILSRLRRLTERAERFGLKVFLYMNEPMGMPDDDPFWAAHPEVRGVASPYQPMRQMCTSTPEVKEYLREGTRYVFAHVPRLAGVLLITASEFPSHCYSHQRRPDNPEDMAKLVEEGKLCGRCASRLPQEVVGEVVALIGEGARAANPAAEVIAWNWSWSHYEGDPQSGVLDRLPADAIVMGDFERGQPTAACGFAYTNDEYSIKVVGPSERFRGVADYLHARGRPVYAKIQIGTTHENPSVPNLPTLGKVAQKYVALREAGVSGMMTCWNFGNMPSLGTEVAGELSFDPVPDRLEDALWRVAARNFGAAVADDVVAGWLKLSAAQDDYPSSIPVMYNGPIARGPAFRFEFDRLDKAFPHSWLLDADPRGDRLDGWTAPFGPEQTSECYRAVARAWAEGVALLRSGLDRTSGDDLARLTREVGLAEICRIQLLSAANVTDFLLARNAWLDSDDPARQGELLDEMERLVRDELAICTAAVPLCEADPRLGWHGEAYGYMFNAALIERKVAGLREILDDRLPAARAALGGA